MSSETTPVAHRQLRRAVGALCTSGELSSRLEQAHRALADVDAEHHLPQSLRHRFDELLADIAYGADDLGEALRRMSTPDREHLADRIVSMFDEALRHVGMEG
ncbi:hypothetical protein [Cognatilysobacter lacus]|uniref:Uncharacterized protein n=1 Tax=Cognatilysobacter lacus TaxID=1643323 RepID=A0A5D8Z506_9GAMM|nr:hypothetical protein [Lysobacter lacus]TZF89757.1 hypothetical protein FW784_08040 [Lysobacter lacus]